MTPSPLWRPRGATSCGTRLTVAVESTRERVCLLSNRPFQVIADPTFAQMRAWLREIPGKWAKELQKRNKKIAIWVADEVQSDYSAAHPAQTGRAENSIRALATQTSASVRIGSEIAPYVLGQNFGSNQGPNKQQFPERKEPDYFLYANIEQHFDRIKKEHLQGVDDVFEEAFPER